MTGQDVVPSAFKPRRGGHLPLAERPEGLPAVPTGPAPPPTQVELMGLGTIVSVMELMTAAERRRTLAFLADRYGEVRP